MPKEYPMGVAPLFGILLMLFTVFYILVTGEGLYQWFLRFVVMVVGVALAYLVWGRIARKSPTWRLGNTGQAEAVFLVVAVVLFLFADNLLNAVKGSTGLPLAFTATGAVTDVNSLFLLLVGVLLVVFAYDYARRFI